jgi:hypothetical protein
MCKVGVRGELFLFMVVMDVPRCHVENSTYNASCTNKKWNIYGLDIMDESITNLLKKEEKWGAEIERGWAQMQPSY